METPIVARTVTLDSEERPASALHPGLAVAEPWVAPLFSEVSDDDLAQYAIRIRTIINISMVLWPCFIVTDYLVAEYIYPSRLEVYALLRLVGWLPIVVAAVLMKRRLVRSYAGIKTIEAVCYVWATFSISLMCLEFAGPSSPYAMGILFVMWTRGLFLWERWQDSLRWNFLLALIYPLVLLSAARLSPRTAAQFDTTGWASFALYNVFIAAAVVLMAVGSNSIWALRRQLFEARAIGRYRLIRRIGSGGMGEVWQAHHTAIRGDVAVKVLRVDRSVDPQYVERFRREVMALAELSHPHTIRIFDYGITEDSLCYYVMELLQGEDLERLVKDSGALEPSRAVELAAQICSALSEAHEAGIIHRDVKPANVFVTHPSEFEDFIKVLDFGIAKVTVEGDQTDMTRTGWAGGTAAYMSPEVVAGRQATPASDVYAVGMVLYFMLAGAPAFEGPNRAAVLRDQLIAPPPSLADKSPVPVSAELATVIARCLEKTPDLRPATARELLDLLRELPEHRRRTSEWRDGRV